MTYSQRDPRWANHVLGYGPHLGTIGEYGCLNTTWADVTTWAGWGMNPAQLDEAFTAAHVFQRDPSGTYDFLPDDALPRLWPARFKFVGAWAGYRADVVAKVLPSKDQFAAVALIAPGRSHFAPVIGTNIIGDPWVGAAVNLGGYTSTGWSVARTIVVQALRPVPPPPPSPTPQPTPQPVPMEPIEFYSFHPAPASDLHPADGAMTLSTARTAADEWVAGAGPGNRLEVLDAAGVTAYIARS